MGLGVTVEMSATATQPLRIKYINASPSAGTKPASCKWMQAAVQRVAHPEDRGQTIVGDTDSRPWDGRAASGLSGRAWFREVLPPLTCLFDLAAFQRMQHLILSGYERMCGHQQACSSKSDDLL